MTLTEADHHRCGRSLSARRRAHEANLGRQPYYPYESVWNTGCGGWCTAVGSAVAIGTVEHQISVADCGRHPYSALKISDGGEGILT